LLADVCWALDWMERVKFGCRGNGSALQRVNVSRFFVASQAFINSQSAENICLVQRNVKKVEKSPLQFGLALPFIDTLSDLLRMTLQARWRHLFSLNSRFAVLFH
jgi:hypothetical protein